VKRTVTGTEISQRGLDAFLKHLRTVILVVDGGNGERSSQPASFCTDVCHAQPR
jgi:hypothetical protein